MRRTVSEGLPIAAVLVILLALLTIISACQRQETRAGVFPDPGLEAVIRKAIEKPDGELLPQDCQPLIRLDRIQTRQRITDLTGLEYCVNLAYLDVSGDLDGMALPWPLGPRAGGPRLTDLSPLSSLTKLGELYLPRNQISDIRPLSSLANLRVLDLSSNRIGDISPLSSLTNLDRLHLGGNRIGHISPLSSLTNLDRLYLGGNRIGDLSPLSTLANLTFLMLEGNRISDLSPLVSLTNLQYLHLAHNSITDISPLSSLGNLQNLYLEFNKISVISPLVDNKGLGRADTIALPFNKLDLSPDSKATQDISALTARGVVVYYSGLYY